MFCGYPACNSCCACCTRWYDAACHCCRCMSVTHCGSGDAGDAAAYCCCCDGGGGGEYGAVYAVALRGDPGDGGAGRRCRNPAALCACGGGDAVGIAAAGCCWYWEGCCCCGGEEAAAAAGGGGGAARKDSASPADTVRPIGPV